MPRTWRGIGFELGGQGELVVPVTAVAVLVALPVVIVVVVTTITVAALAGRLH
jgi:hypothetical protein